MLSITLLIIIVTVLVSLASWNNQELFDKFKLNPYLVYHKNEWWRLLSCTLVHANYTHLAFNMFSLYFIGDTVEGYFKEYFPLMGKLLYFGLYVLGAIFSCITDVYKHKDNFGYNSIGASGAVSAVIFSFIIFAPTAELIVFVFPMRAFIYGGVFLAMEYYLSKQGGGHINHGAHFEGAILGVVYTLLCQPSLLTLFIYQVSSYFSSLSLF